VGPAKVLCMYFQIHTFHTSTATECTVIIIYHHINSPQALKWKIALAVVVVWVLFMKLFIENITINFIIFIITISINIIINFAIV